MISYTEPEKVAALKAKYSLVWAEFYVKGVTAAKVLKDLFI